MVRKPLSFTLLLLMLFQSSLTVCSVPYRSLVIPANTSYASTGNEEEKKESSSSSGGWFRGGSDSMPGDGVIFLIVALMYVGAGITTYNYLKHGSSVCSFMRTVPQGTEYHLSIRASAGQKEMIYSFVSLKKETVTEDLLTFLTDALTKDFASSDAIQLSIKTTLVTPRKKVIAIRPLTIQWNVKTIKASLDTLLLATGTTHLDTALQGASLFAGMGTILGAGFLLFRYMRR